MRVLFSFVGGYGHFRPLVPIARAARAAGHEVAVLGQARLVPAVEAAGLTAFGIGDAARQVPERRPLQPVDPRRDDGDLREIFARAGARARVPHVRKLCADWRPDVLVCDEVDFGCMLAAEEAGLPYASVTVLAAGSFIRPAVVGPALAEVRASYGLPPDPELEMLRRWLVLSPVPPSFRDPGFPAPSTAHPIRSAPARPGAADDSWWPDGPPDAPRVYCTLGTVFNLECGDLFARLLAGLASLPVRLLLTVGEYVDPAEFGPVPANVRIEHHVPQDELLPSCDLMVSHAGSGSVLGALAHGVPMVLVPMGADQPPNASRCAELGVARTLDPVRATPEEIGAAATAVLAEPAYRRAARRLRDESAALPGPAHAVTLLERLVAEHRPLRYPGSGAGIELRGVDPDDWRLWREARLAALAEAPYAFGSRLADWREADERRWRDRLGLVGSRNVLAVAGGRPVGMVSGVPADGPGEAVELISMWVAPAVRGHGVGDRLVEAVVGWARATGRPARLCVAEDNVPAIALYGRHGFALTGEVVGLMPDGVRREVVMATAP